jgi:ABC-type Fe3+ transport system permease subunit
MSSPSTAHTTARTASHRGIAVSAGRAWAAVLTTVVALTVMAATLADRLRGNQAVDDRGSDSTEKSFMVILAIGVGTLVLGAATAYVVTKTNLFKDQP